MIKQNNKAMLLKYFNSLKSSGFADPNSLKTLYWKLNNYIIKQLQLLADCLVQLGAPTPGNWMGIAVTIPFYL